MSIDVFGTETSLPEPAAWSRLRTARVGRLAVVVDARPEIFPVSFVVDRASVVFRTAPGTKLEGSDGRYVALEADGLDEDGAAWSVVVKGRGREIVALHEVIDALFLPLSPLHPRAKPHLVRIEAAQITGRWFRTVPRPGPPGRPAGPATWPTAGGSS